MLQNHDLRNCRKNWAKIYLGCYNCLTNSQNKDSNVKSYHKKNLKNFFWDYPTKF